VQETAATEEPTIAEQADQTDALLREIERLRSTTAQFAPETTSAANEAVATEPAASETPVVTEQPTAEEAAPATTEETPAANTPRGQYNANNDSDLIDQLEGIRSGETDGESDDLIAQIKKLLDGVE
jgi:ABC-type transporter Mla subunit MlaD